MTRLRRLASPSSPLVAPALALALVTVAAAGMEAGCVDAGAFACASDASCMAGRACIAGRCALADDGCPSRYRWDDTAGDRAG